MEEGSKRCEGSGFLYHVLRNSVCGYALILVFHTNCGIVLNPDEDLLLEGDLGIYLTRHLTYYFYMVYWFFYIVSWVFEETIDKHVIFNYNLILLLLRKDWRNCLSWYTGLSISDLSWEGVEFTGLLSQASEQQTTWGLILEILVCSFGSYGHKF